MLDHTPEAERAILARERTFARRLRVDWGNDGQFAHDLSDLSDYVAAAEREQVLSSNTPAEVLLIEGHAAARLDIDLAGNYGDAPLAAAFAPYNRDSPFYASGLTLGVAVTYELAIWTDEHGFEWFPQFTGIVRDVIPNRDGTLRIECLDNVERLRGSVSLPPYALWQSYLNRGFKRGGLVDSSSIIDLAARAGGFTAGPQMWPHWKGEARTATYGPILSVPLHGSLLPEFGMLDNAQSFHLTEEWEDSTDPGVNLRAEAYVPGPHGYLALGAVPRGRNTEAVHKYWIDEFAAQAGDLVGTYCLGGWIYYAGPDVDEDSAAIEIQIRRNKLQLVIEGSNGGVAGRLIEHDGTTEGRGFVATGSFAFMRTGWNWVHVEILVENSGNYAMRARVNESTTAEARWSGRFATNLNDPLSGLCIVENKYAISDVYVTKLGALTTFENFTYDTAPQDTAAVSWGRNRLAYTLRENGREAWDLATEVAAAEYGVCLFDEAGRFLFLNYTDLVQRQAADVRSFGLDDLSSLGFRVTLDSVRNVWTVTTRTGRAFPDIAYDLGRDGVPFKAIGGQWYPADFRLPPNSANVFWFNVGDNVIALNPWNLKFNSEARGEFGVWEDTIPLHALKSYSGTTYRTQAPNTEQKMTTRTAARLYMTNGFGEHVGFVLVRAGERDEDGQPRFRIEGTLVHEDEPITWAIRDEASIATYGERVIELDESFWLQDRWQTEGMLTDIVARMGRPIPVSDDVEVPGDPRVQVLDCVELRDRGGFGDRIRVQLYGLTRRDDDTGITDRYAVEVIEPPGPGMWDSSSNGEWDSTLTWS